MTEVDPKQFIEANKDVYNTIASHFSNTRQYLWRDLAPLGEYSRKGDAVLDLGCGNGRLYQLLEKKQVHYTGFDQSEGLIKKAQEKFPEQTFVVGEMTELPFEDESFDVIYSIAAFHHLPTWELRKKALGEMYRVLKPGKTLVMTNWNLHSGWTGRKIAAGEWKMEESDQGRYVEVPWKNKEGEVLGMRHYWGFTFEELEQLFIEAGFAVEKQYYVNRGDVSNQELGENIVSIVRKS